MNFRFLILIFSILFAIFFSIPSLFQIENEKKINFGLDLQGGVYMLLGINNNDVINFKLKGIYNNIKNFSDKNDILIDNLKINKNFQITFDVLDEAEFFKIKNFISQFSNLNFKTFNKKNFQIYFTLNDIKKINNNVIKQNVQIIRNRLDKFGLNEPVVTKQGKDKILIQIAGMKTQKEEQRLRKLILQSMKLSIMPIDENKNARVENISNVEALSYGDFILPLKENKNIIFLIKNQNIIDGKMIKNVLIGFSKKNQIQLTYNLNDEGRVRFSDFSSSNIGKRIAIILNKKLYAVSKIGERISGGTVQMTGNFNITEAKNLAIALTSGSLVVPVHLLEERTIGPSLGKESIKFSIIALISGFILVIFFMIIYYKLAGVIANIALISNLFIILGVMSLFEATLTLPGMAGIILTVGMSVDANVIITERIREFIKEGYGLKKSIEEGYRNAITAILDSNITTLLASFILYGYGTGPLKGFAITMSIGIIGSMITSIIGTLGIYQLFYKKIDKIKNINFLFGIKG